MSKTIVFDMGNVIVSWNPSKIASMYSDDKLVQETLVHEILQSKEWSLLDQGTITLQEAKTIWKKRLSTSIYSILDDLLDSWYQYLFPIEAMIPLVKTLKEKQIPIYLLSNASIQFKEYYQNIEAFQYFDGFYVSAFHQMMKPDFMIYQDFLNQFHLQSQECLFIDDVKENIAGAKKIGMSGYVFDGDIIKLKQVIIDFLEIDSI